ncbi:PIG-L deacetylase family protein [Streptomyces sp. NBC_01006]|uniref:PIG-L deacetylase family protein n=1 Tax=Streptomyces sp. NBC_01006 TaxID=2903716 RepID=UPI00386EEB37|nr:PIG-L family deacetylase [Streptomyces sp. NBC_01006]
MATQAALGAPRASAAGAPAIFYAPHQDDEAIGMAGSILEHKAAGRPVYLVLVSRGENDGLARLMNVGAWGLRDRCAAPDHWHDLNWPTDGANKIVSARTAEFTASAKAIGVDEVIDFDLPDSAHGDATYGKFVDAVTAKVESLAKKYPGASHKFSAGWLDVTATHKACSDAAYRLKGASGWEWSPKAGQEPKRDATYILMATSPGSQQPGSFLTTTVHLRSPEFESVTATTGVHTPWVEGTQNRGRVTFTTRGAQFQDDAQALGTVAAATADVETVTATWVRGRDSGAGWIRFPSDGIKVGHGAGGDLGTVTADKISVNGINTQWVGDRDAGKGWIEFPQSGVSVRKDGNQEWGTVAADKADLNGINTKWVQGRTAADGWIEFPAAGLNVFQGAENRQWGTVAADKADLNDLITHRAQVKERLTLQGGLTVDNVLETQDGPPRLIVHAESEFEGKVNANGHLSVRNADVGWIMHTRDDLVAINGDLRVHGALRSDS